MAKRLGSVCLTACALLLSGFLAWFQAGYLKALPSAAEFHRQSDEAPQATQSFMDEIRRETSLTVTACTQRNASAAAASGKKEAVSVVYTDPCYPGVYPLAMRSGGFWITGDYAVIPDVLAQKLFLSADCIDAAVTINGISYKVCGVYRTDGGFLDRSCGAPQVLLPSRVGMAADMVSFAGSESPSYFLSFLPKGAASLLSGWLAVQPQREGSLLIRLDQAFLFLLVILFLAAVWPFLYGKAAAFGHGMRTSRESSYFREAFRRNRGAFLKFLFPLLGCAAAAGAALYVIAVPFPLPSDFTFPNLFDLRAWGNLAADRISRITASPAPSLMRWENEAVWSAAVSVPAAAGILMFLLLAHARRGAHG